MQRQWTGRVERAHIIFSYNWGATGGPGIGHRGQLPPCHPAGAVHAKKQHNADINGTKGSVLNADVSMSNKLTKIYLKLLSNSEVWWKHGYATGPL